MKKNLKILFIVVIIMTLLVPIAYSYVQSLVEKAENEKFFFEVMKTEVTKNEKIEMILNLDKIEYNEFIFELKSDEVIENLEIVQNNEVQAEKNNKEIVMEINKEKTNVKTINLYYTIPENKQLGDTIKFIATITNITNNDKVEMNKEESKATIENEETDGNDEKKSTEEEKSEETNIVINKTEKLDIENNEKMNKEETKTTIENEETDGNDEKKSIEETKSEETNIIINKTEKLDIENNEEMNKEETKTTIANEETDEKKSIEEEKSEETNITINKMENFEIKSNEERESETKINESIQETQSIEVEIKIVEKIEDDKQKSQTQNTENNKQGIEKVQTSDKNNISSLLTQKTPSSSSNYNISINNNQVEKVTYKGSDNNYLSELSVEGYAFNRAFSKENTTYFVTVGNQIGKLDIIAKVDDNNASVNIYGHESLKEGTNKILITVTAENGNIRNYRIYVIKNI